MINKIFIVSFTIFLFLFLFFQPKIVNVNFAEEISLKYNSFDKQIDVKITDEQDINELKKMFKNKIGIRDTIYCGFHPKAYLEFKSSTKTIKVFPASDGCASYRINNTNQYLSGDAKFNEQFKKIVGKYDMTFPFPEW